MVESLLKVHVMSCAKTVALPFLLLTLIAVSTTEAAKPVPLKIRAQLTICTAEECPEAVQLFGAGGPNRVFAIDVGNATHFGQFRTVYAADVGADGSFVGKFQLTAADGSKIYGMNSGFLAAPDGPSTPFTAHFMGGTKRFQHTKAYVKGTITAGVDGGPGSYRGQGKIILDTRR